MELIDYVKRGMLNRSSISFFRKPFDHLAGNLGPYELFGVVEARLDQIGQVVVLSGADQSWGIYR